MGTLLAINVRFFFLHSFVVVVVVVVVLLLLADVLSTKQMELWHWSRL